MEIHSVTPTKELESSGKVLSRMDNIWLLKSELRTELIAAHQAWVKPTFSLETSFVERFQTFQRIIKENGTLLFAQILLWVTLLSLLQPEMIIYISQLLKCMARKNKSFQSQRELLSLLHILLQTWLKFF